MNNKWKSADEMLELAEKSRQINNEVELIVSEILEAAEIAARDGEMSLEFIGHGFGSSTLRNHRNLSSIQIKVINKLWELGYVTNIEVCGLSMQELRSDVQNKSRDVFLRVQWKESNGMNLLPRVKLYSSLQKHSET